MDRLTVVGGVPLAGTIHVSGAKNAALKLMAAALLTRQPCVIRNVPRIVDVATMMRLLEGIGARARWTGPGEVTIEAAGTLAPEPPPGLVRTMRASVQLMGPLLARTGRVRISQPGGCNIGERPLDLHLQGLAAMGATVAQEGGFITLRARRLHGADIVLDFPSVGATENLMMAATLAQGSTLISNAAREPEVMELQGFLRAMGARVEGAGGSTIRVEGVAELAGARWELMPDRIETATWMVAAAITGGRLRLEGARAEHVAAVAARLRAAGAAVEADPRGIEVAGPEDGPLPVSIRTQPYPGFPTDVQPQWAALMAVARGTSVIREEIYSHRFQYVRELWRMGADITVESRVAIIRGVRTLTGASLEAPDLRGGAALVLAALAAQGESQIRGVHHLDRGYQDLEAKLRGVGARIQRVAD